MTTEEKAKLEWKKWGHSWCMTRKCSSCGEIKVCRGKTKRKMLCLDCFDQGATS